MNNEIIAREAIAEIMAQMKRDMKAGVSDSMPADKQREYAEGVMPAIIQRALDRAGEDERWQRQYALTCLYIEKAGSLQRALGALVDAVNVELGDGRSNIGGRTGPALIQAVDALADADRNDGPVGKRLEELRQLIDRHCVRAGEAKGADDETAKQLQTCRDNYGKLSAAHEIIMARLLQAENTIRYGAPPASADAVGGNKAEKAERDAMALAKYASVDAGTRKEETPRTEHAKKHVQDAYGWWMNLNREKTLGETFWVKSDFARTIERELNEAKNSNVALTSKFLSRCEEIDNERTAQLSSLAVQLEEAKARADLEHDKVLILAEAAKTIGADFAALKEDKRREREQAHLHVIALLPLAKGYASANPVGNNWKMCEEAGAWLVSALSANPRLLSEGGEGK